MLTKYIGVDSVVVIPESINGHEVALRLGEMYFIGMKILCKPGSYAE